jgi:hypothetical protein
MLSTPTRLVFQTWILSACIGLVENGMCAQRTSSATSQARFVRSRHSAVLWVEGSLDDQAQILACSAKPRYEFTKRVCSCMHRTCRKWRMGSVHTHNPSEHIRLCAQGTSLALVAGGVYWALLRVLRAHCTHATGPRNVCVCGMYMIFMNGFVPSANTCMLSKTTLRVHQTCVLVHA